MSSYQTGCCSSREVWWLVIHICCLQLVLKDRGDESPWLPMETEFKIPFQGPWCGCLPLTVSLCWDCGWYFFPFTKSLMWRYLITRQHFPYYFSQEKFRGMTHSNLLVSDSLRRRRRGEGTWVRKVHRGIFPFWKNTLVVVTFTFSCFADGLFTGPKEALLHSSDDRISKTAWCWIIS